MSALEITTAIGCPNNCKLCPQDALLRAYPTDAPKLLSLEHFMDVLLKLPPEVRLDFSGFCEPFVNRLCKAMIVASAYRGRQIRVYTTLWGLKSADIRAMEMIPFDMFMVHLPDAEGIMPMPDHNYRWILQCLEESKIQAHFMTLGNRAHPDIEELVKNIERHPIFSRAGLVRRMVAKDGVTECVSCGDRFNHNVLLPNGDVVICCMDYGLMHKIGNLFEQEYADLKFGPAEICKLCERSR